MAEHELLKAVIQKAQLQHPASYLISLHYAEFQANTTASAISATPIFVEQPLYFPLLASSQQQAVQCKVYTAGEGPPLEVASGSCEWCEEESKVQRRSVVLKDENGQEIGSCELVMHTIGCAISDAISRTASTASWLSIKCLAFPKHSNPTDIQASCMVNQRVADISLRFEQGFSHKWTPLRLIGSPPQLTPESEDVLGYHAQLTLYVAAEEERTVSFPGLAPGEPQICRILLNGQFWLLEICTFTNTVEQLHVIEQVSAYPMTSGSVLVATPLTVAAEPPALTKLDEVSKGGIMFYDSNVLATGWQSPEGLIAGSYEYDPESSNFSCRGQYQVVPCDDDVVDPTRELHFKLQAAEDEEKQQLLSELSIKLRAVTHHPATPSAAVPLIPVEATVEQQQINMDSGELPRSDAVPVVADNVTDTSHPESESKAIGEAPVDHASHLEHSESQPNIASSSSLNTSEVTRAAAKEEDWFKEKNWLQVELQRKQNTIDRLLVEFHRRGEALEQCGEEMHRLRLEKRDTAKSLKEVKSELRKSRNQSELQLKTVVRNAFGHDLSVDSANAQDLRQVIRALADRLAVVDEERMELKRTAMDVKATKMTSGVLQKQFNELQSAHLQQAAELQKLQSAKSKVTKYQETILTQEKVITRLQSYVGRLTGQGSAEEIISQADTAAELVPQRNPTAVLDDTHRLQDTHSTSTATPSTELQATSTAKNHRIAALEKQLVEAARNASREVSELKMQLFDNELKLVMAGVSDNQLDEHDEQRQPVVPQSDLFGLTGVDLQSMLELPAIPSAQPGTQQVPEWPRAELTTHRSARRTPTSRSDAASDSPATEQLSSRSRSHSARRVLHTASSLNLSLPEANAGAHPPTIQTEHRPLNLPSRQAMELGMSITDPTTVRTDSLQSEKLQAKSEKQLHDAQVEPESTAEAVPEALSTQTTASTPLFGAI